MNKSDKAVGYFNGGYNCAQSVVAALCEELGMTLEEGLKVSEGFGGGMGRMRSVCGAVTGMFMLAGLKYSKAVAGDMDTRKIIYQKVQDMSREFEQEMGTIICAELLEGVMPENKDATPTPRTNEFYKKRPCTEIVRVATEIAEKHLLKGE
ncbi:MAG: C_GCAxxG_C_C family protein [Eubacteriales bacterium]|nr:C_GCAxxG_C_C family protein [Eubacteriales bacterium]